MKKQCHFNPCLICSLIFIALITGCSSPEVRHVSEHVETACIRGTVWHHIPNTVDPVTYPQVGIYAWSHEQNTPLTETKTDKKGNFCIEVPAGNYTVDLRVIGLLYLDGESFKCRGSQDGIVLEQTSGSCAGECMQVNIATACDEFSSMRRK